MHVLTPDNIFIFLQKTERYVFLLDGLAVCCKPRGVLAMYRLKEKINLRHVKLADLEETESAGMMRDVQG